MTADKLRGRPRTAEQVDKADTTYPQLVRRHACDGMINAKTTFILESRCKKITSRSLEVINSPSDWFAIVSSHKRYVHRAPSPHCVLLRLVAGHFALAVGWLNALLAVTSTVMVGELD